MPATGNWVYTQFRQACERVGIEKFRFHDLRHDAASRLVMRGVDLQAIKEILGHKTLVMTARYAHGSPAHILRAVRVLDEDELVTGVVTAAGEGR